MRPSTPHTPDIIPDKLMADHRGVKNRVRLETIMGMEMMINMMMMMMMMMMMVMMMTG